MAAFTATPFRGHGLSSVVVSTTFGATNRLPSIVESRYARNYIPKFQAEFHVAEEEPDRSFQRLVERYRQGFSHNVVGLQDPGADRAHPKGTSVNLNIDYLLPTWNF